MRLIQHVNPGVPSRNFGSRYEHRIHAVQNILPMVAKGQITRALMPESELRRLEGQALCFRMDAKQMPGEDHWLSATLFYV